MSPVEISTKLAATMLLIWWVLLAPIEFKYKNQIFAVAIILLVLSLVNLIWTL